MRESIERRFGRWGRFCYHHPWKVILPILAMLAALYSHLPDLQVDTTMESFFHEDDPTRVAYNEFRANFGRDDLVIIAVETDEVFDRQFLEQLTRFHRDLEQQVPLVHEVQSLVNARQTLGRGDELLVQDFLETIPESAEALQQLKQSALHNPVYVGTFVSKNSRYAALMMENETYRDQSSQTLDDSLLEGFDETPETQATDQPHTLHYLNQQDNTAILQALDALKAKHEADNFRIYMSGGPYSTAWFLDTVRSNMTQFTGLAILIVVVLLFAIFRRWIMVFVPLGVAILSMLASMSLVAALDFRVSFSMQIVPSFLIAIGVGNCVHVFTVFFQALQRGDSKENALAYAMQHSGLAILMTGLTTAGSLLAFTFSDMKPIAEFGMMTPIGVIFALFFSLMLLPAIIRVFPIRSNGPSSDQPSRIRQLVVHSGLWASRHPRSVLATWLLIGGLALYSASHLQFSFHIYNNLPPDHFLIRATQIMDEHMSGIGSWELVIDSGEVNGVKQPEFLRTLEAISRLTESSHFTQTLSIVDINKELHQALNRNDPDFYAIPDDPLLIAQELFLFENSGSDDLEQFVDSQFRQARLSFRGPILDGVVLKPILNDLLMEVQRIVDGAYTVVDTSLMRLSVEIFTEMPRTMASSYLISFLIITPLMIFLIGSLRVGLVSMLPNLLPILLTLGVMGALGIHLTSATLLTGSIAIGLVVDDTIHFMHNFQRYFARTHNVAQAIQQTLETTGQAIFFTSVVLSSAFFIFMLNEVNEWSHFGLITGLCILFALAADLLLAPALVTLLFRKQEA